MWFFFSWTDFAVVLLQVPAGFFLNIIFFTNVCGLDIFGVYGFFFPQQILVDIFFFQVDVR